MLFIFSKKNIDFKDKFSYTRSIGDYNFSCDSEKCKIIKLSKINEVFILGDCINYEILNGENIFSNKFMKKLKGLFILISISNDSFQIYSSLFGILPVYFTLNYKTISNSIELIKEIEVLPSKINKQFILESYLFNYSFSNRTYIDNIKRLDAFSGIMYKNGSVFKEKYENILNWFTNEPLNGSKYLKEMAELFIQQTKQYYCQENNSVSFTSGFDGRSIASVGLLYNKIFETFSWGSSDNDDVKIPRNNAKELGLVYRYYNLHEPSYIESYLELSRRMSKTTGGFNGFLYPHFLFGALKEKRYSNTLLVGYCGSELFRALHIQGAVSSKDLVLVFNEPDDISLKNQLWNSEKLSFIVKSKFTSEFENLFEEILEFRKTQSSFHTKNHFFYSYIFSEVFRKVFGSWASSQMEEIIVRVPFLDYDFVIELLKTDLAGCNNDFFIHNPFKRLNGQQLYAEIIRQSNGGLYKMKTGKGYRPIDLLTLQGKVRILFPYLKKKLVRQYTQPNLDNLGIISAYQYHKNEIDNLYKNLEGFEISRILESSNNLNSYTSEEERDILLQTASLASIL